jgi:hypothetical protein
MPQGYVWVGNSGCLLPLLIILNLLFGKLIFGSTGLWLGIGAVLVLIFILKVKFLASKIYRQFNAQSFENQGRNPSDKVVDIQGQVVEEDKRLK